MRKSRIKTWFRKQGIALIALVCGFGFGTYAGWMAYDSQVGDLIRDEMLAEFSVDLMQINEYLRLHGCGVGLEIDTAAYSRVKIKGR